MLKEENQVLSVNGRILFTSEIKRALHLKHIILSHHGKLEFGSPISPKTPEAIVVSTLEGLDAKFNHLYRILKNSDAHHVKSFYDSFLDSKILTERLYKTSSNFSELEIF